MKNRKLIDLYKSLKSNHISTPYVFMGNCLFDDVEPAFLLCLVMQHTEDDSAANAVLVVNHLRRNKLTHVWRELTNMHVEYKSLPILRSLMLLKEK